MRTRLFGMCQHACTIELRGPVNLLYGMSKVVCGFKWAGAKGLIN